MERSQRGLNSVGMLIVLAVVVALGYYAYLAISGEDEASCRSAFTACMQKCRRTTTEAPAAQVCQEACQRDEVACERPGR